jgi:hypothetical protein
MEPPNQTQVQRTQDVWQRFYPDPLTEDDARAIGGNIMAFFDMLLSWSEKEVPDIKLGDS